MFEIKILSRLVPISMKKIFYTMIMISLFLYSCAWGAILELVRAYVYFFISNEAGRAFPVIPRFFLITLHSEKGPSVFFTYIDLFVVIFLTVCCLILGAYKTKYAAIMNIKKLFVPVFIMETILGIVIFAIMIFPMYTFVTPEALPAIDNATGVAKIIHILLIALTIALIVAGASALIRFYRKSKKNNVTAVAPKK